MENMEKEELRQHLRHANKTYVIHRQRHCHLHPLVILHIILGIALTTIGVVEKMSKSTNYFDHTDKMRTNIWCAFGALTIVTGINGCVAVYKKQSTRYVTSFMLLCMVGGLLNVIILLTVTTADYDMKEDRFESFREKYHHTHSDHDLLLTYIVIGITTAVILVDIASFIVCCYLGSCNFGTNTYSRSSFQTSSSSSVFDSIQELDVLGRCDGQTQEQGREDGSCCHTIQQYEVIQPIHILNSMQRIGTLPSQSDRNIHWTATSSTGSPPPTVI